jgi:hypothetical protein
MARRPPRPRKRREDPPPPLPGRVPPFQDNLSALEAATRIAQRRPPNPAVFEQGSPHTLINTAPAGAAGVGEAAIGEAKIGAVEADDSFHAAAIVQSPPYTAFQVLVSKGRPNGLRFVTRHERSRKRLNNKLRT